MFQTRAVGILSLIVAVASPAWAQSARLPAGQKWVATWAASVHGPYPSGNPSAQPDMKFAFPDPAQGAVDQSFRLIVKPDLWGDRVRIRLANTFGTQPVTFSAIYVGVSASAGNVVKGTNRAVSFGGQRSVTIAPGAAGYSDRCRTETACRSADGWAQAGRVVPHRGLQRSDDLARQGAADVVSQPAAIGQLTAAMKMTPRFHTPPRRGTSSTLSMWRRQPTPSSCVRSAIPSPTARCRR